MEGYLQFLISVLAFALVAIAANQVAKVFLKVGFPLITGLLITGVFAGPFILELIPFQKTENLHFVNNIAFAYIAFAAGAELYLRELKSRFKSITWMTFGQLVATFTLGAVGVYFLADYIYFMQEMTNNSKIAVSILMGTIFVARSPASLIAVINELRAKGPFTSTALGVTVLKDVIVIVLFVINLAIANVLITDEGFDIFLVSLLLLQIVTAFAIGYVLGKLIAAILSLNIHADIKKMLVLFAGYNVYMLFHFIRELSHQWLPFEVYIEPLLICIIGSFVVTNYSKYRPEFLKILNDVGPIVYVAFFTLIGVSMSLNILVNSFGIAIALFGVRILGMIVGSFIGGTLGGDPMRFNRIGWMPYITQAGVALGLAAIVPAWGVEFETIVIAIIVISQLVGPPFFKWSINHVNESRIHAEGMVHRAVIFGLENQSIALARQLKEHGWDVNIATRKAEIEDIEVAGLEVIKINGLEEEDLENAKADHAEAVVCMLSDTENYKICKTAYERFGTKDIVVRLEDRNYFNRFHKLGALIVEPSMAIVSLLDHFVRSPVATSLLLGMEQDQDTVDIEIQNADLYGIALRDLRLPADIIILSIKRAGQMLISHGYTRLRKGDIVTVVGSVESIEKVTLRFED